MRKLLLGLLSFLCSLGLATRLAKDTTADAFIDPANPALRYRRRIESDFGIALELWTAGRSDEDCAEIPTSDAILADDPAGRVASLTPSQLRILEGLKAGRLNKQIAFEMNISERTVKMHRAALLKVLGVRTAADAIRAAVEAEPESWQAWYRLGWAYDAAGDRRRARGALRRAVALERSQR